MASGYGFASFCRLFSLGNALIPVQSLPVPELNPCATRVFVLPRLDQVVIVPLLRVW